MKSLHSLSVALLTALLCTSCIHSQAKKATLTGEGCEQVSVVLFVCEHGSAKSVVAAAHFNQIAREQNLNLRAIARGTNPDEVIPPKIIQGLQAEGLSAGEWKPLGLSKDEVVGASRVVTFCQLPEGYNQLVPTEQWNDVPPLSEDYNKARDAIVLHIKQLLNDLQAKR